MITSKRDLKLQASLVVPYPHPRRPVRPLSPPQAAHASPRCAQDRYLRCLSATRPRQAPPLQLAAIWTAIPRDGLRDQAGDFVRASVPLWISRPFFLSSCYPIPILARTLRDPPRVHTRPHIASYRAHAKVRLACAPPRTRFFTVGVRWLSVFGTH